MPRLVLRPLERFLQLEAGSASLLMLSAVAALVWVNAAPSSYEDLWSTRVSLDAGALVIEQDLRHVINDLLMAVFFYVVALEVKREMVFGSLRDRQSAALPVAAALGTMVGAALTYVAVNLVGGGELGGWAIPIATDIAFAIGALGLVGKRAPTELRAFLLTLAVVDDLGTIAVIGVFFSDDISAAWLGAAVGVTLLVVAARRVGVRSLAVYVLLAGALWLAVFESGVHATIAGVVLGFLTPALALHSPDRVSELLGTRLSEIAESDAEMSQGTLLEASRLAGEAASPLARMHERLHPWSAYLVLPLFALANAGVPVSLDGLADALSSPVGLGIFLGLVVGAPVGGVLLAWIGVRLKAARLADGLDWPAIGAVAPLKGIGFTVAIFISALSFDDAALQEQAKLTILIASAVAALIGVAALVARGPVVQRDSG
ncbi:MAG: Na+/H+ antiporter NhaA [Solirubrobacterales bacterium]